MYRNRCRPAYSSEQLREMYAAPHSSTQSSIIGPDHADRIERTLRLAQRFIDPETDHTAADLSCGDGRLIDSFPFERAYKGDFAAGYELTGPIEETIELIPEVDVFFLCESLEHIDRPDELLLALRLKAGKLILSTPICTWWDENIEHYWAWDVECVRKMLRTAGWKPSDYEQTEAQPGYIFQIHAAV